MKIRIISVNLEVALPNKHPAYLGTPNRKTRETCKTQLRIGVIGKKTCKTVSVRLNAAPPRNVAVLPLHRYA
jgi:hypothetical protein